MICKHCGREIEKSCTVCPYCKTPIIRIKVKRICAYCKTEVKKGDKICPGCGRNVPEKIRELLETEDTESFPENVEKRSPREENLHFSPDVFSEDTDMEQENADFLLLMLSLLPPVFAIFSKVFFTETGFLPWYITAILIYFASSMLLSYFLDASMKRLWEAESGKKLGELRHLLFYLCPPYTLFFFLKKRKDRSSLLLFLMTIHFALVIIIFYV